jgi:hypothetical protein
MELIPVSILSIESTTSLNRYVSIEHSDLFDGLGGTIFSTIWYTLPQLEKIFSFFSCFLIHHLDRMNEMRFSSMTIIGQ